MPRKKKENNSAQPPNNQPSPYYIFNAWLFDGDIDREIDEKVLKAVNPRSVLCMFGGHGKLTIFLNDYFNTFKIMSFDHFKFYKMIKEIIIKKGLNRYQNTFYKFEKENKEINSIRRKFPYLKTYEIDYMIKKMKDNNEDQFLESIGIIDPKKEKIKKPKKVKSK